MSEGTTGDLFADDTPAKPPVLTRREAITDAGLAHFQSAYPGEPITKRDLFYYIYGLLHSEDYRCQSAREVDPVSACNLDPLF